MSEEIKTEPIRKQMSIILGTAIPKNGWKQTFAQLNREGRIDQKVLIQSIIVLCEKIEEYEQYE